MKGTRAWTARQVEGVPTAEATGRWRAVWLDLETAREQDDVARVMTVVLTNLDRVLSIRQPDLPRPERTELDAMLAVPDTALLVYLGRLAALDPRPLVMLFDEADGLVGRAMVSFLTQLRQGYVERPDMPFPASVALVGQRQVRDYVLREEDRAAVAWLGTTSPFNVTAEALTLTAFSEADVAELLQQHTSATGQRFEPEAVARIHALGQGHPWLTNALADQIVRSDVKDRTVSITDGMIERVVGRFAPLWTAPVVAVNVSPPSFASTSPDSLQLQVEITRKGFVLSGDGIETVRIPAGDVEALTRRAQALEREHPGAREVTLRAADDVELQTLIDAMDALRGECTPTGEGPRCLFSHPILQTGP